MQNPLSLEAFEVLDAIDRRGSFAAAADSLYRVPSAVSYTVQKLEQDLGVVLFKKVGRRSVLTDAGRLLLDGGREILCASVQLAEQTRQVDKGWESSLVIAVDSILETSWLFPLIEQFYGENDFTEISLHQEVLGGAWESVALGRADLVVGAPAIAKPIAGIKSQPFVEVEWVFAVAAGHPLASAGELTEQMIAQYRAVVARDSSQRLAPLSRRLLNAQPVIRVSNLQEKVEAQLAGLGVGYLPRYRIEKYLKSGELVMPQGSCLPETNPLFLLHKAENSGRALAWFVQALQQVSTVWTGQLVSGK